MQRQQDTIKRAIKAFHETTGLKLAETALAHNRQKQLVDAVLQLQTNGTKQRFAAECKTNLTQQTLGMALKALERLPQKGMLVAEYVNPAIAEQLRIMGIPFIDTAGNAFINEPPLYIHVTGKKPPQGRHKKIGKTFNAAGLKVLFLLLCKEDVLEKPFRTIAKLAGVALGTVGRVMEDLKVRGYLLELKNGKRILTKKHELLEQWILIYATVLRPKLIEGRYKAPEQDWWKTAELNAYWGGEIAAAKLTKYLKPATATIYTYEKPAKLIVQNKLKPDEEGEVEILTAFWAEELNQRKGIVPPLLVYTDLMATGDARNIETAKIIYEQELAGYFKED